MIKQLMPWYCMHAQMRGDMCNECTCLENWCALGRPRRFASCQGHRAMLEGTAGKPKPSEYSQLRRAQILTSGETSENGTHTMAWSFNTTMRNTNSIHRPAPGRSFPPRGHRY